MSIPKPSDLPHQRLQSVKTDPLEISFAEVDALMDRFMKKGFNASEAIQLTDITLSNILEQP